MEEVDLKFIEYANRIQDRMKTLRMSLAISSGRQYRSSYNKMIKLKPEYDRVKVIMLRHGLWRK
jgi:hypothetical protein